MNPMFSRILKALCALVAVAMLSACGGATSTVDPFVATRVIAFGDGFSYVNASGAGLSTVQTGETDITITSRISARYGIVVKDVATGPALAATGGFSYASATAKVSDVATQINTFLTAAGGVVAKKDLIIITVGNWDIKAAAATNDTAAIDTATTALVTAIQRLTNAGAERVLVIPSTNMSRTPWATTFIAANPGVTRATIQNLSNSASTSFNYKLSIKLGTAYTQDRRPVLLLDPTTDFNTFAGSVNVNGTPVANYSGVNTLTNLSTAVCAAPSPAAGCTTAVTAAGGVGVLNASAYLTSVFADEINLTPVMNRFLADRMIYYMVSFGWAP